MKKLVFLFIMCVACLLFCASCASLKYYQTTEGGTVTYTRQSKTVSAIAENGYRFVDWSDGVTEPVRDYDKSREESVTARFEPIHVILIDEEQTVSVPLIDLYEAKLAALMPTNAEGVYRASWGSRAVCERFDLQPHEDVLSQLWNFFLDEGISETSDLLLYARYLYYTPTEGGELSATDAEISASPQNGYRFVGWADGVKDAKRTDAFDYDSLSLEAVFEPIRIEMYANGEIFRSVPIQEFMQMEQADLFVSCRGYFFLSWEMESTHLPAVASSDAVEQIKLLYEQGKICAMPNVRLNATFTDSCTKEFYAYRTIAHAMGGAPWLEDNNRYLNSLEVFEYHYRQGQRFFEVDLCLTVDGKTVAAHEYETTMRYEEFMAKKCEGFTPLDLPMLIDLMIRYPDVRIDLDILSVYRSGYAGSTQEKLTLFYDALDREIEAHEAQDATLYDRLVLEIFFESPLSSLMLTLAKNEAYGFCHFMYSGVGDQETPLGTKLEDLEALCVWCVENGVTMMSTKICDEEFIAMTDRYDIYTFAYTYNTKEQIEELLDIGIDCVFTDFIYL